MSKPLKVAMIGVGGIAKSHMPGWLASEYTEVVACCDVRADSVARWQDEFDISVGTTEVADILYDPEIDIVDICTPNRSHAPLTIAALDAGKHVICEKPLAPTPEEIRGMINARDRSGKKLMTAQHFRFHGNSQAVKQEIEQGALGEVYHARSWMLRRNGLIPTPTFIHQELSGGGPCIDIGVHILDLTLWLMGNPQPVAVTGVARAPLAHHANAFSSWQDEPIPTSFDTEDFAAAFVRFENEATLILEVSWLLHHEAEVEDMQMWLYGTEGGCHWPSAVFLGTNYATRQQYKRMLQSTKDRMEPHALECVEFARAVAEDLPSPVPAEQSLQVMSILDGIYRSQREGREVRITGNR
ncbi:MAG: Gfo/Idh/MocA family oxidoreductase [Caldilineales bacterium]|nr:Gfo/Idh/MocA family oxidoreductase [Caldilineales bacterium]